MRKWKKKQRMTSLRTMTILYGLIRLDEIGIFLHSGCLASAMRKSSSLLSAPPLLSSSNLVTSPLFSCLVFHFSTLSFHSALLKTSFCSSSKSFPPTLPGGAVG
nr:hypothetical protein Iba_chr08dCG9100 [Ipomoea batatas]